MIGKKGLIEGRTLAYKGTTLEQKIGLSKPSVLRYLRSLRILLACGGFDVAGESRFFFGTKPLFP